MNRLASLGGTVGRLGIPPPNPLLPSRPRLGGRIFWRGYYSNKDDRIVIIVPIPNPRKKYILVSLFCSINVL